MSKKIAQDPKQLLRNRNGIQTDIFWPQKHMLFLLNQNVPLPSTPQLLTAGSCYCKYLPLLCPLRTRLQESSFTAFWAL